MTIAEARTSCKAALSRIGASIGRIPRDVLLVAVLILASLASFGLGVLAAPSISQGGQGSDVTLSQIPVESDDGMAAVATAPASLPAAIPAGGQVVASKNGTKYYPEGCAGAARISAANRVAFDSASAAEAAGYSLAAACKGQ